MPLDINLAFLKIKLRNNDGKDSMVFILTILTLLHLNQYLIALRIHLEQYNNATVNCDQRTKKK